MKGDRIVKYGEGEKEKGEGWKGRKGGVCSRKPYPIMPGVD